MRRLGDRAQIDMIESVTCAGSAWKAGLPCVSCPGKESGMNFSLKECFVNRSTARPALRLADEIWYD